MPVTYPDALEHWDRSRAFGDPRDFQSFANDMESLHPGEGFGDAANRDGWWTRLSTRLDQNVFDPLAKETTQPLGRELGGLFGQPEAGARVGAGLPRMLAETAPLYLTGVGVPAAVGALATGGLMGAHTYAETGSPKAAVISGVTGAALPKVGDIGGELLTTALGLGERVAPTTLATGQVFGGGVLPKAGVSQAAYKASQFIGSQAAQAAAITGSQYAESRTLGTPFEPFNADYLLQQIPFTVFDAVHLAQAGKVPTKATIQALAKKPGEPPAPYTPPSVSQPEAEATISVTMAALQKAYVDPTSTPEQKAAALAAADALIKNPRGVTAAAIPGKTQGVPTTVTGYAKQYSNGQWKVLSIAADGSESQVWVNNTEPTRNPDGTYTFNTQMSQVSPNVATPLRRQDFGLAAPGQPELPGQPKEWEGFGPDQQAILERHGVPPPSPEMPEDVRQFLRETADDLEVTQQQIGETQAKINSVPQTAEEIPSLVQTDFVQNLQDLVAGKPVKVYHGAATEQETLPVGRYVSVSPEQAARFPFAARGLEGVSLVHEGVTEIPEHVLVYKQAQELLQRIDRGEISSADAEAEWNKGLREYQLTEPLQVKIRQNLDAGATATQAVEKARLQTQTPQHDAALKQLQVLQDRAKKLAESATFAGTRGSTLKDEKGNRIWFATREEAQTFWNQYKTEHPDVVDFRVAPRTRKGVQQWELRIAPRTASIEGAPGTSLENVLTQDPTPVDTRPDVSKNEVLSNLAVAEQSPDEFSEFLSPDFTDDPTEAPKKARITLATGGDLDKVNAALEAAGLEPFVTMRHMKTYMTEVMRAADEFGKRYTTFTMGSNRPFDQATVDAMGILHPDDPTAIRNTLQWFINRPDSGAIGDFLKAVLQAHGTDGLKLKYDARDVGHYVVGKRTIVMGHLPSEDEAVTFATAMAHEYIHDVTEQAFGKNTPTAVQLRATLREALDALKVSPEIPADVRKAMAGMPEWYAQYTKDLDPFALYKKWTDTVGGGKDDWYHFVYGLTDEHELMSTMFNSPKMVEMMMATKMPKKPLTVMQHLSQVWNRLFGGGKAENDNVFSQILTSLDNYLTGDRVPPRIIEVKPTLAAGENFLYGLAPYDPDRNLLGGKYLLPKDGTIPLKDFRFKGGIGKNLTDGEIALYRSLVPDAFSKTQVMARPKRVGREKVPSTEVRYANEFVNVPKLVEGLRKNGPVVETKTLGQEPEVGGELANLRAGFQHNLETAGYAVNPDDPNTFLDPNGNTITSDDLPEHLQRQLQLMLPRLREIRDDAQQTYSFVAPKPESQMPGYVVGLVRVPVGKPQVSEGGQRPFTEMPPGYRGPHFGSEDTNVLAFYRGYEETLPDGTKAFHVIEVQSDWGQRLREEEKTGGQIPPVVASHPLLQAYEQLALKAAIQHAQEIGASKVILSDAETAMMTEGHDQHAGVAMTRTFDNLSEAEAWAKELDGKVEFTAPSTYKVVVAGREPSQAAGMRLHYDQLLPRAMEQLTREKGMPVDLGQHKAAKQFDSTNLPPDVMRQVAEVRRQFNTGQITQEEAYRREAQLQVTGSPVFKDAAGNPKTQITGRSYDISKVPEQQALFEPRPPAATVRQSYNGRDFVRDYLISEGVRPDALASRLATVEKVFNTGSLDASIKGFEAERDAGLLPATMSTDPLKPELTTALTSGTPKDVEGFTKLLLMTEVPVHEDLVSRLREDFNAAVALHANIKKGLVPGEAPNRNAELNLVRAKINAMIDGVRKQKLAIQRWNDLDNFTTEGIDQTRIQGLSSDRRPSPPDPTEMHEEAQAALGLVDQRREVSRERLEQGKGAVAANWVRKNFMFMQYLKDLVPAAKPVLDKLFRLQGQTNSWKNELDAVYEIDPTTKEFDDAKRQANFRVATNETLSNAASEIKRWNQTEEAAGRQPSLADPYVKNILSRFNKTDRDAIVSEANNARAVHDHYTEVVTPKFLAQKNQTTVATAIALREQGMKPDDARDLAGQFAQALDQLKSPQTAQLGIETLNAMRSRMQPETFLRAFSLTKDLDVLSDDHMAFMRSRPNYVTEQRFGDHMIRMATPDNKPFNHAYDTKVEADAAVKRLEAQGYKFIEYIPRTDANVPVGGIREDFISKLGELDQQRQNLMAQSLQGVDPNVLAVVLPAMNRANDYTDSLLAFKPVPGAGFPKRHFVAGREEINMVENQNMFYGRAVNWMRHQLTRAETSLDMLHPDLLSDRELTKQMQDKVTEFLSPDSVLARKMSEFTYNWKLAGNFGVNALHLIQSLNTGMASLISETGSVGDALALTIGAQKAIAQRVFSGKWESSDHDWLVKRAGAEGVLGNVTWEGDIGDSKRNALQYATTPLWRKPAAYLAWAARTWNNVFFKFNDAIGLISAFDLGRSQGMSHEEAFNFATDIKNRGYFTGGKAQRPGFWSALGPQAKAVPQLMASLQTYVNGWFSMLAYNYTRGFGKAPAGMSAAQVLGAKKAFLYQLGAQAVLAGALGLPGVGQGMALVKQSTGVDVMAWLRQHLGDLFDEDQNAGGLMTTLALHGATAAFTPVDISGKHMPSVPYIGVTPYKGFDLANLAGAPVSSAADLVKGLMAAAKGDVTGASSLLPEVLKGPLRLWQGEGDVRDKSGNLITKLSPFEQFVTALGMKPARVNALQDTATAVKEASARASREKSDITDRLATVYRQNGVEQGHLALLTYLKDHPDQDARALVQEVSRKVLNQTTVPDWSQRANVGADLTGLGGQQVSQAGRLQQLQSTQESLGLQQRPSRRTAALAEEVDLLRQTDPSLSVAEAMALARRERPQRRSFSELPQEYQ